MTDQLEMAARHPQAWKLWQQQHGKKTGQQHADDALAQREAELKRAKLASMNGIRGKVR